MGGLWNQLEARQQMRNQFSKVTVRNKTGALDLLAKTIKKSNEQSKEGACRGVCLAC